MASQDFSSLRIRTELPGLAHAVGCNLPDEITSAIELADAWSELRRDVAMPTDLNPANIADAVEALAVDMSTDASWSNARSAIGAQLSGRTCAAFWNHAQLLVDQFTDRWTRSFELASKALRSIDAALGEPDSMSAEDLLQANKSKEYHQLTNSVAELEQCAAILLMDCHNALSTAGVDKTLMYFQPVDQTEVNILDNATPCVPGVDGIWTAGIRAGIKSAPRRAVDTLGIREAYGERQRRDDLARRLQDETPEGRARIENLQRSRNELAAAAADLAARKITAGR